MSQAVNVTTARRARVVVLTTTYPRWISDTEPAFVHRLSRELTATFDVLVLAPHTSGSKTHETLDGVEVQRVRYLPARWQRVAYDGGIVPKLRQNPCLAWQIPFLFGAMFFALLRVCLRRRPAVIHAHWVIPQGLIALAARRLVAPKTRVVTTAHGADLYSLNGQPFRRLKRFVLNRSDVVTVVSQSMAEYCREALGVMRPITVRSMGIDTRETFRVQTPFEERDGIVFVGRLVEKKGCATLVEAFGRLVRTRPELTLTVVGDGPERRRLNDQVSRLGISEYVNFAGAVPAPRVAEYFNAAKIAVMPSIIAAGGDQEGLGLVAAEALASGCITITSDIEAVRDVHDTDWLKFSASDVVGLASCLEFVLDHIDEARRECERMRAAVTSRLDWSAVGADYSRLLAG